MPSAYSMVSDLLLFLLNAERPSLPQQQHQQPPKPKRNEKELYTTLSIATYGHNFVARLNPPVGRRWFTDESPNAMAQNRFVLFAQRKAKRALLLHHDDFEFLCIYMWELDNVRWQININSIYMQLSLISDQFMWIWCFVCVGARKVMTRV